MTNTEPPPGLYRDKDYGVPFAAWNAGYWEHASQGWRFYESDTDTESSNWTSWAAVKEYGPFTPRDAPAVQPTNDTDVRKTALESAVRVYASKSGYRWEDIIEMASKFEDYLRGEL